MLELLVACVEPPVPATATPYAAADAGNKLANASRALCAFSSKERPYTRLRLTQRLVHLGLRVQQANEDEYHCKQRNEVDSREQLNTVLSEKLNETRQEISLILVLTCVSRSGNKRGANAEPHINT